MANNKYTGSFRSVVDLSLLANDNDGKLPTEIQVLPKGEWLTVPYGPMSIDENVFEQMVANFDSNVRKRVPIDVDHDGGKAAGWIKKLINKADEGLWAAVKWTSYGEGLLRDQLYALFSPEWSFDYLDPEKSTHHGAVLIAGSLTNRPLFKELKPLVANDGAKGHNSSKLTSNSTIVLLLGSEEQKNMTIAEILAKKPADRTDEEVKQLNEATDLSDEQKSQLETEKAEADAAAAQAQADADKAKADAEAAAQAEKEKVEKEADAEAKTASEKGDKDAVVAALQKKGMTADDASKEADNMIAKAKETVTITASELAKYQALEKESVKLAAEKSVEKYFTANEGKVQLLPAVKGELVELVLSCNETQKASLIKILETLPSVQIAGEAGKAGQENMKAYDQLKAKVEELMAANDKLSRAEAWKLARDKNADLAKQVDSEI